MSMTWKSWGPRLRISWIVNDLWKAHGALLEEVQMLGSQVIALRSGGWAKGAEGWFRGADRNPEGPGPDPVARVTNLGGRPIKPGALAAGMRDLGGGWRTKTVVVGGAK